MENIRFDFSNFHRHGTAFYDFLALRKQVFVDDLGWDIPHDENVEMDQYDTPIAQYSLVLKDGKVVGGARGMATTAIWGEHTYMLRDAYSGTVSYTHLDVYKRQIFARSASVKGAPDLVSPAMVREVAGPNENVQPLVSPCLLYTSRCV